MMKQKEISVQNQKGFTLVELLIATSIFAVIILVVSITVIQISKLYYKGIVMTKTQDSARSLTETISRTIQFEGGEIRQITDPLDSNNKAICIGSMRISYMVGKRMAANPGSDSDKFRHIAWLDEVPNADYCLDPANMINLNTSNPSTGRDLLSENMRVNKINVNQVTPGSKLVNIEVKILYGARDLMIPNVGNPDGCKGLEAGSQWCAVAEYDTSVLRRIGA